METALEKYLREHSSPEEEVLEWLTHRTNIRTNYGRMLSGPVQGKFLTMIVALMNAKRILEIGAFTGYSSICLASGTGEDGHVDSLEINDELEDLIAEGHRKAGVSHKITMHYGDAKESLEKLKGNQYDLAFIDANKREYCIYYEKIFDMIRPGGCIIADDVLWNGKVYAEIIPQDKQTQGIINFNELIVRDPRVEVVILPLRDGISIIRKKS